MASPTVGVTGSVDEALEFDTNGQAVEIKSWPVLDDADQLTLAFWFNADSTRESDKGHLLSKTDSFNVDFSNVSDKIYFSAKRWDGSQGRWRANYTESLVGTTHHLAIVYDYGSASNDPIFYLDGDVITNVEETAAPTGAVTTDVGADFFIGN